MPDIATFFREGGNLMYVNLGVSMIALAIVGERVYVLNFRLAVNARRFLEVIESLVMAGNYDRAIKMCTAQPNAALPRVVRAALGSARLGGAAISAAVEEAMSETMPLVTKRAGVLFGIANIATLIGLIGTVFGLIQAFASIALAAPEQKQQLLTAGIAHAMNNTAFGLSIAVVCIVAHVMIGISAKNLAESLDHGAVRVENMLARKKALGQTGTQAPAQGAPAPGVTA